MRYSKVYRRARTSTKLQVLAALKALDQALAADDEVAAIDAGWVADDEEPPPTVPRPEFAAKWAKAMNSYPDVVSKRLDAKRNRQTRP